jgi:hypothetical protein
MGGDRPASRRVVLTPKLAREIYEQKLKILTPTDVHPWSTPSRSLKGQSVHIANRYNVSAKTIRDIWNRRTWTYDTSSLWHHETEEDTDMISLSRLATNCRHPPVSTGMLVSPEARLSSVDQTTTAAGVGYRPTMPVDSLYPLLSHPFTPITVVQNRGAPVGIHPDLRFLSVSEDPGFLPTSAASEATHHPWPCIDPFRDDWPHWDQGC